MANRITDTVSLVETVDQARVRLAEKARKEGVKITFAEDGRWYASSVSKPGTRHFVTAVSCDCEGFFRHQRCKHHSALLACLGWLDLNDEPVKGVTIAHVDGHYSLPGLDDAGREWQPTCTTIALDGVDTVRITGDSFELSVHWLENGKPIDDMTGCTPSYLEHADVVAYWIASLDATADADYLMQQAGIFPAREVLDDLPAMAIA